MDSSPAIGTGIILNGSFLKTRLRTIDPHLSIRFPKNSPSPLSISHAELGEVGEGGASSLSGHTPRCWSTASNLSILGLQR